MGASTAPSSPTSMALRSSRRIPMAASTDKERVCYFTDILSAETRINIYQHLFGPDNHAELLDSGGRVEGRDTNVRGRVETAIFAVNKLVHDEALETFYNQKVICVSLYQLNHLLSRPAASDLVRKIGIIECKDDYSYEFVREVLRGAHRLPRLKSVIIFSDWLSELGQPTTHVTVREYVDKYELGEVVCTDIGRHQLKGTFDKVRFQHSTLLDMWLNVATMPDDYDAVREAEEVIDEWDLSCDMSLLVAWASHTSLRLWVALHEMSTSAASHQAIMATGNLGAALILAAWVNSTVLSHPQVAFRLTGKDGHVPLHKLNSRHDAATLEAATELLSMNLATYNAGGAINAIFGGVQDEVFRTPRWVELGDESEGAEMSAAKQRAMHDFNTRYMIQCPCDGSVSWHVDNVRTYLLDSDVYAALFGVREIQAADKDAITRMVYFCEAMEGPVYAEAEYEYERDEQRMRARAWSVGLLSRYLRQCGVGGHLVEGVDVAFLREVFMTSVKNAISSVAGDGSVEADEDPEQKAEEKIKENEEEEEEDLDEGRNTDNKENESDVLHLPLIRKIRTSLTAAWASAMLELLDEGAEGSEWS